ncbi:hypothetical protein Hanom_Chr11g01008301 [Helianthus anomalus]
MPFFLFDEMFECLNVVSFHVYSLSNWELFKACMAREILLMKRNSFVYIFKTLQVLITTSRSYTTVRLKCF